MIPRLSDLLDGALRGAGLEATSIIWQIAEGWSEIVGPRVARHAAPIRLRRGELVLSAPDAVWRQELTLLGPEIARKVNKKIEKEVVRRVRLVAGPSQSPSRARGRRLLRVRSRAAMPEPPLEPTPQSAPPPAGVAAAIQALSDARATRLTADREALQRRRARPRLRR